MAHKGPTPLVPRTPARNLHPAVVKEQETVTCAMELENQSSMDSSRLGDLEKTLESLSMELRLSQCGTKKWRMVTVATMATLCTCAIIAMILPLVKKDPREPELMTNIKRVKDQAKATVQLGTIVAWVPFPSKSSPRAPLPDGWLPCNGTTITNGPWRGQRTPDLNNGHFLRGSDEGQALIFEEDQLFGHSHTYKRTDHSDSDGNICGTDVAGCSSKHNLENPTEDSFLGIP